MGKILDMERVETKVTAMFYRVVLQVVLLLVSESRVLFIAMEKTVKGSHTGFLRQIMAKQVWRMAGGTRLTPAA